MYGVHLKSDTKLDDGMVIRINSESTLGLGANREAELGYSETRLERLLFRAVIPVSTLFYS